MAEGRYGSVSESALRIASSASSFWDAMPDVLRALGEGIGWDLGIAWQADPSGAAMRFAASWRAEGRPGKELAALSATCVFSPGVGLPGRVLARREVAWMDDVQTAPTFPRAPAAAADGLHAAFGFPLLEGRRVLGMIEYFSDEVREPDAELLAMVESLGESLGSVAAHGWPGG